MIKMVFTSGKERYERVSKAYAHKHWLDERIDICPCNLRPGFPWAPNMTMHANRWEDGTLRYTFAQMVNEFTYYNCTNSETGYYPSFYKVTVHA